MPSYYGMDFGFRIANLVWWVDHGWTLGGPKAPLLLLLRWMGEKILKGS